MLGSVTILCLVVIITAVRIRSARVEAAFAAAVARTDARVEVARVAELERVEKLAALAAAEQKQWDVVATFPPSVLATLPPSIWATLPPFSNTIGMSFRSLPAGPNGLFSIGVYEVSQEQYEAVMGTNPSDTNGKQNPVDNVSWDDAVAYCAKLSSLPAEAAAGRVYRLPTEAEWDYACRAGTTTFYSFGDDERQLVDYAWFNENSGGSGSHPVGQKKPNGFGLYDMHGNEWEWCSDIEGSNRVSRGGSSDSGVESCRTANRLTSGPTLRTFLDGFRLAWSFPSGQSPEAEQGK